jgi:hypothetical protein
MVLGSYQEEGGTDTLLDLHVPQRHQSNAINCHLALEASIGGCVHLPVSIFYF